MCEDPSVADAHLGAETGEVFRARLADMRAAETVEDLPVGQPSIEGEMGQDLRLSLGGRAHLIVRANHTHLPLDSVQRIDWTRVAYIRVIEVGLA